MSGDRCYHVLDQLLPVAGIVFTAHFPKRCGSSNNRRPTGNNAFSSATADRPESSIA
jgi:hypothetical protein